MASLKVLGKPISLLIVIMIINNSCASMGVKPSQDVYYTIPSVTYLRESPGYASPNVATVYRSEQVVILSKIADDWCQVQTLQGRHTGWIQRPLLSPVPIPTRTYFIQESKVPLQDTPQKEGTSRQFLYRGDKVRKLFENQEGWWWVLVEKGESLGWIAATTVSERQPETASPIQVAGPSMKADTGVSVCPPLVSKQFFYVATTKLNLHLLPLVSSQVVKVLRFNDRVEKIDQSGSKWLKVRYPGTGAQGWAYTPFLAGSSLEAPKVFPLKNRKPLRGPRRVKPAEPEKTQPEGIEPEVM